MESKKKCIIIYTEGETEYEFYDLLMEEIKKEKGINKFNVDKIVKQCLKGITKFDKKLLKKFEYDIKTKYSGYELIVFLCYDTDVFDFNAKPPVNWDNVDAKLKKLGAKKVYHIKAEKCIEDIFLTDIIGICKYLNISQVKKINGQNGVEKMRNLFIRGNRIYQKGFSCEGFVKSLNISLILKEKYAMFSPLIKELLNYKNDNNSDKHMSF